MKHGLTRRAKRLECGGLPALLDPSRQKAGASSTHSKRFAPDKARPTFIVCGAARGMASGQKMDFPSGRGRGRSAGILAGLWGPKFITVVASVVAFPAGQSVGTKPAVSRRSAPSSPSAPFSSFVAPRAA